MQGYLPPCVLLGTQVTAERPSLPVIINHKSVIFGLPWLTNCTFSAGSLVAVGNVGPIVSHVSRKPSACAAAVEGVTVPFTMMAALTTDVTVSVLVCITCPVNHAYYCQGAQRVDGPATCIIRDITSM